jgi:hypothetical protein
MRRVSHFVEVFHHGANVAQLIEHGVAEWIIVTFRQHLELLRETGCAVSQVRSHVFRLAKPGSSYLERVGEPQGRTTERQGNRRHVPSRPQKCANSAIPVGAISLFTQRSYEASYV